ncbi:MULTISPECIES: aminoacyl-histidine dipeptidase [unclassified Sedimentibacter]|uniref:aminoacyl-histidine dipeptidase n=1 Tax=unclassified Sedimentibacter TaxID=2649220 RepID=UPI0027DF30A0|nr:aminoacyl-histidine dipeptidase [Sedimentibacter sp. MB35-C1]WMJ75927.1 aminoacyl-histidine dipeptidase [Sedimentibacter sp. MB35-C1]
MKKILNGLEPESVFKNFEDLTRIPRGSGNEKEVSDFLVSFANKHKLEVIQDPSLNVIIQKNASPGYENSKRVILQGHMDMVALKEEDIEFDFFKDPIPLIVDGDMIRTKGTTLGADNGIAVAMAMSILESENLQHPPITALFTVSEEMGMDGVMNLEPGVVSGDILINMDSEEEGKIWASCAGGVDSHMALHVDRENAEDEDVFYGVSVRGLLGGHSGMEINKNRGSAIVLLGRLLQILEEQVGIGISYVQGGVKMNAIPKNAAAVLSVHRDKQDRFKEIVKNVQDIFRNEYSISDPDIIINLNIEDNKQSILDTDSKKRLINTLRLLPFGVQAMSTDIEGLVETSNNIGILETKDNLIIIRNSIRSSVKSRQEEICGRLKAIGEAAGAEVKFESDYPAWQFKKDSPIRDLMIKTYKDMFGKNTEIEAIHAGLECGFLKEKIGDIDMVSMGPDMYDVHTPNEHLSISSTKRVFEFLCEVLKRLK